MLPACDFFDLKPRGMRKKRTYRCRPAPHDASRAIVTRVRRRAQEICFCKWHSLGLRACHAWHNVWLGFTIARDLMAVTGAFEATDSGRMTRQTM